MGCDAVFGIEHRRNAALGIERGALIQVTLAEHRDLGEIGSAQGQGQPRRAAAYDENIECLVCNCCRLCHRNL